MWEKRYAIERKYDNLLTEKFSVSPYSMPDLLDGGDKSEEYVALLNAFKWLFSQGEEAQTYLWNKFCTAIDRYGLREIDKNDFSAEELKFLKSIKTNCANNKRLYGANADINRNINRQIETDRLILTPFNEDLNDQYREFFQQHPDEFERYYDLEADEKRISYSCKPITGNLHFAILLKDTKEYIGVVALDEHYTDVIYNLEYFIMPNHRQKGYACEAVQQLIDEAFNNRLFILEETIREEVFKKTHPPIRCIVAQINIDNEPSIKCIEKFGFNKDGVLKFYRKLHDNYLHHNIYTLDRAAYCGRKKV